MNLLPRNARHALACGLALTLALAAPGAAALERPLPVREARGIELTVHDRYVIEVYQAGAKLRTALRACSALESWSERELCEMEALDRHRNEVGLAKARYSNEFPARG